MQIFGSLDPNEPPVEMLRNQLFLKNLSFFKSQKSNFFKQHKIYP